MLTQFKFESQEVRFVLVGGEVYFVAKDIAHILGYQDTAHAILDHIDKEDTITDIELRRKGKELSQGHFDLITRAIYTNESGVYALIFGSTKPEAKTFKRWLTKEVLPSIRKTGSYSVEKPEPITAIAYYSNRVHLLKETLVKDTPGTWCVIEKCSHLLLDVEKRGYVINEHDLLDGSVGIQWSNYRKGKDWAVPQSTASYDFRNSRGKRVVNAYFYCELGYFSEWLETIYEVKNLPIYLLDKELKGTLQKAKEANLALK
jgi:prophage antirepressor-like protein